MIPIAGELEPPSMVPKRKTTRKLSGGPLPPRATEIKQEARHLLEAVGGSIRNLKKEPSVIVVDDDPYIQLAIGSLLTRLGCKVDKASNGEIGVEMVSKKLKDGSGGYSMIFMDANMPVMSGYEAAKKIKQELRVPVPVICVSAQDSVQHNTLCAECGMSEVVSKPCTINKLRDLLRKYNLLL